MQNCNKCNKSITEDEFNNGCGECLECFPDIDKEIENIFMTIDEDGLPY